LVDTIPDILFRIVSQKRAELARAGPPFALWEQQAERHLAERRDFRCALAAQKPAVIAEIKKASPSKGILSGEFDPVGQAKAYQAGGAAALSVLTDQPFFQGSLEDLGLARDATTLPVLRKDFTLDERHVLEAAAYGADAILLIAAILDESEIRRLRERAAGYGMAALVEVHDAAELERAKSAGAEIIGVNNRDLNTFRVNLETSLRLVEHLPAGALKVSESGINGAADVRRLLDAGYDAFLVGEHLMKSGHPAESLRALVKLA
jgi:indole-3-glycerol phosphate synthase